MRAMLPKYLLMSIMLLVGLTAVGHTAEAPAVAPTITVEADGKVMAIPDQALLTLEVETRAPQAEAATRDNARRSEALLKALKQALGPDDRVKTLGYRLSPVYAAKDKTSPRKSKATRRYTASRSGSRGRSGWAPSSTWP